MDYLPRGEGSAKTFGGIEVTVKQITKKADYTVTTLNIADSKVIMVVNKESYEAQSLSLDKSFDILLPTVMSSSVMRTAMSFGQSDQRVQKHMRSTLITCALVFDSLRFFKF